MDIVTLKRLNDANCAVISELGQHGFYDEAMQKVDTYLVYFGHAYGWQWYGTSGEIDIPMVSISRLSHLWRGGYTSLRDVLRHEFGHAVADTHRELMRSTRFVEAFDAAHDCGEAWEFDPEFHVSEYAATSPSEDFAETFMLFLKHSGNLPKRFSTAPIKRKWRFIRELGAAIAKGKRRWPR